jgi:hypothetical protein
MDTVINIMRVLLIFLFTVGGVTKLTIPYTRFVNIPFQAWANDFKPGHVRFVGVLELTAGVAMIATLFVPSLTNVIPFIAVGMALVMAGAIATHLRRSEYLNMAGNATWLGLALFVAYGTLVGFAA